MLAPMADGRRGIGAMARESGLGVSALRFYDAAGVFHPARVDASTGYRWYDADQVVVARLIAALRRVSMPVPDICAVLAARADPVAAGALLEQHLRRLEAGLADARLHVAVARDLLDEPIARMTVRGRELFAAFRSVKFAAAGDNPGLPGLNGMLFDYDGGVLRLVTTDRHRLAVATVAIRDHSGPAMHAILPSASFDRLRSLTDTDTTVRLTDDALTLGDETIPTLNATFPDYRRRLQSTYRCQISIRAADLRERLRTGPDRDHPVISLRLQRHALEIVDQTDPDASVFNREFLLEAVAVKSRSQLVLASDGPIEPLAIYERDQPHNLSMLMPIRLP
jgi:DNA-binding transcriptional MerR regulator